MSGYDRNKARETQKTLPPLSVGNTRICIVPGDLPQRVQARAETAEALCRIFGRPVEIRQDP